MDIQLMKYINGGGNGSGGSLGSPSKILLGLMVPKVIQ